MPVFLRTTALGKNTVNVCCPDRVSQILLNSRPRWKMTRGKLQVLLTSACMSVLSLWSLRIWASLSGPRTGVGGACQWDGHTFPVQKYDRAQVAGNNITEALQFTAPEERLFIT